MILFLYDNDLRIQFKERNYLYVIIFFGLIIGSTYIWEIAGKNPGIVGFEINEILKNSSKDLKDIENNMNQNNSSQNSELKILNSDINFNSTKPQKRFCEKCQIIQPYRTKHCNSCEACIAKYDHHCFWIGGCVGELNLRKFFLMLFLQSVLFGWILYLSFTGLAYNSDNYEKLHNLPKNTFTKDYGSFVLLTIICIASLIFVLFLFFQYVIFILTNVSMWEATVFTKISYLRVYPHGFLPFNEGLCENLKGIFCHGNIMRDWDLPDPDSDLVKRKFNLLDNEFYSCC